MKRRILVAAMLLALLSAVALPVAGVVRADSSSLTVSVSDGYPGTAPAYTLTFVSAVSVSRGATLTLTFDDSVGSTGGLSVDAAALAIDGTPVTANGRWAASQLTLVTPVDLAAGVEHTLRIAESAGIQNPWTEGHYRITLDLGSGTPALVSNYYSVTRTTQLVPVQFSTVVEYGQVTGVRVTFRTGRSGSLVGHDLIRNAQGYMVYPTTEDTFTVRLSAGLSALWSTNGRAQLQPSYAESPFPMTIISNTVYDTDLEGNDLRQLVLNVPHNIPSNVELSLTLLFASPPKVLPEGQYVRLFTSKETAVVTIPPLTSSEEPGGGTGTGTTDTTAPVVTWSSQQNALLPRLVTIAVTIDEANLDEAWFSEGPDSFIHTRLWTGTNTLMVVNRAGIHGTIVATDKAGNNTTVAVDIPALSGS
ncbi:MAG TPA: hypothetical protein PKH46_06605 [Candidatus Cryosericum sp.]|nr:hypothetical protein [Candidatus Cryosericum sp.]